jgi:hypothetical protein
MRNIFLFLIICLLLSGNAFAETKLIDKFHQKTESGKSNLFSIYTFCIDGYKFITTQDYVSSAKHGQANAVATSVNSIQFMIAENGKMIPAKCE